MHKAKAWQCGQEAGSDTFGWSGPWIIEARSRALLLQLPETKQIITGVAGVTNCDVRVLG